MATEELKPCSGERRCYSTYFIKLISKEPILLAVKSNGAVCSKVQREGRCVCVCACVEQIG